MLPKERGKPLNLGNIDLIEDIISYSDKNISTDKIQLLNKSTTTEINSVRSKESEVWYFITYVVKNN